MQPATAESVAPFGALIGAGEDQAARSSAFYGDKIQLWTPGRMITDSDACLSLARVQPRVNEVIWMERHFKHTQTFVPLGGVGFIAVLGRPSISNAPNADDVVALRFSGNAGLMMHIGTWHEFPFAIDQPVDLLVILRNETNRDLEVRAHDEALGGDLEKRNLRARLGFGFEFSHTPSAG